LRRIVAGKIGRLEPLAIGKVRGFRGLADERDLRAGLAGDSVKSEAFREALAKVLNVKVRRFGTEMGAVGRKWPADGDFRE
jgi:hypothetical protein